MWLASSWWRLSWEPLPKHGTRPSLDWRMAHEMGAANHGFVWPRVLFASDGEFVSVWAEASGGKGQSVNYLAGLDAPQSIPVVEFQRCIDGFVEAVLSRLRAVGCDDSELKSLWGFVQEDRADNLLSRIRQLEAQLGFDPEECPEDAIGRAIALQAQMGDSAMSELAPIFGKREQGVALGEIDTLSSIEGLQGKPQVAKIKLTSNTSAVPWKRGIEAARNLRDQIGSGNGYINNEVLCGLLGLTKDELENWIPPSRLHATVAVPVKDGALNYVSRRRHPIAKRFEFSRLLGDYLCEPAGSEHWLTSTDLATSRQKYQRAFAAEFLCPINSLVEFLEDDFSDSAIEEASERFGVSEKTVESLLMNNGYLESPYFESGMPYRLAA